MGLDQYARVKKNGKEVKEFYFRKNYGLENFLGVNVNGGERPYGEPFLIPKEMIELLEERLNMVDLKLLRTVEENEIFYKLNDDWLEEDHKELKAFVTEIKESYFGPEFEIYYDSNW